MNLQSKTKEELIEYIQELSKELDKSTTLNRWFEEQFRLYQHQRFASKSEKIDVSQLSLFNEIEKESDSNLGEPILVQETVEETKTNQKQRKEKRSRDVLYNGLPVERIEHHLENMTCSVCDHPLHVIKQDVTKYLKIIPPKVILVEEACDVCGCRNCENTQIHTPIITAPKPNRVITGSIVSPSMLAYVMDQKYVMSVPLYRQEQQFKRWGVDLSRQNLANWMIKGSEWLEHIYNRLHENLIKQEILMADETTLQVLKEPGKAPTSKSYMWLYRTGRTGASIALYDYQPSRQGIHPENFLNGFKGYLQVDGYKGYDNIPDITLVSCWAHARRYFFEAITAQPKKPKDQHTLTNAERGFLYISELYKIEDEIKELSNEERYKIRLVRSQPILEAFSVWLNKKSLELAPKSKTGQAITYCLNQWTKLCNYLLDGRLEIDNNRSERTIKNFVIGRKNFLFSNTPKGAKASAIIYSIVETAKGNNLKPFEYLHLLFEQLPNIDLNNPEQIDSLLPWNVNLISDQV